MVTIQPLHFEKVTAFKERIQLLNKINEIIAELDRYPTKTEMMEYVSDELSSYYTKEEVNELLEDLDLSDYYTKEEVNTINNLVNYYNITQLNATFENINNRIISGEETLEDEIAGKQDLLTAGDNITIVDNVISAVSSTDWELYTGNRSELITNGLTNKDIKMEFHASTDEIEGIGFIPKGTKYYSGIGTRFSAISYFTNSFFAYSSFDASSGNVLFSSYYWSSSGSGVNAQLLFHGSEYSYDYYREGITTRYVKVYVRG